MRKFLFKIFIFIILLISFDIIWGLGFDYIESHIEIGGTGRNNYICNKVTDDIIILGSSRAENHYNAQMIEDSLGLSCYNCGQTGCGITLNYGRLLLIKERHTPKMVIYEITPEYDYLAGNDNHKSLTLLKNYCRKDGIDSIFHDYDRYGPYKLLSGLYRHNSSFLQNSITYFLNLSFGSGIKGFRPIDQEMDTLQVKKDYICYDSKQGYEYDPLKLKYFNRFLESTNDITTVLVISPMWYDMDDAVLDTIKSLCDERGILLLNYANSPKYNRNNDLFMNGTHLNAKGADEFTRDLIKDLKNKEALSE